MLYVFVRYCCIHTQSCFVFIGAFSIRVDVERFCHAVWSVCHNFAVVLLCSVRAMPLGDGTLQMHSETL